MPATQSRPARGATPPRRAAPAAAVSLPIRSVRLTGKTRPLEAALRTLGVPASRVPAPAITALAPFYVNDKGPTAPAQAKSNKASSSKRSAPEPADAPPSKAQRALAVRDATAARRVKKHEDLYEPMAASSGKLSLLEKIKVSDPVRHDYVRRVGLFEQWREVQGLPAPKSGEELLPLLLDRLDAMFLEGDPHGDGEKLVAGIQHLMPEVAVVDTWHKRVKDALSGWEKRGPAASRAPPPKAGVMAIVGALLWGNRCLSATNVLLAFLAYARPGEVDSLRVRQAIAPSPSAGMANHWGLLIGPMENDNPAKSGEREESILIDNNGFEFVNEIVMPSLTQNRDPSSLLLPITPEDVVADWQWACQRLRIDKLDISRYALRHAGASHEVLNNLRSLENIKLRGRWKTDSSMRRYLKAAKAMDMANKFPAAVLAYGIEVEKELPGILSGATPPSAPA